MANIKVYSVTYCPYCRKAKALLNNKNIPYEEIDITDDEATMRPKLAQMTGGKTTVPQIFINDTPIGGCDDLHELERSGKLDEMLAQNV